MAPTTTTAPATAAEESISIESGSIVFDIETMPLPMHTIRDRSQPFSPPPHPGEFDPFSVKTGHLKDPVKVRAKVEEARKKHQAEVDGYSRSVAQAEADYWQAIHDRAALSPLLGRVLAIGVGDCGGQTQYLTLAETTDDAEGDLLFDFWGICQKVYRSGYRIIGHNIHDFDLPFLLRRSWMLCVGVPEWVFRGRYLADEFVDTRLVWNCGSRMSQFPSSLDVISQAFNQGRKTEGMNGGDFWKLFTGTSDERQQAMNYLENDIALTRRVATRLGLL